ncbi:LysR family transcriptional regulator [Phenylobacterium sp.]|jgi:DNA-binding transcriptional LysR family regulator|uniref:LysR family transcriptional regulator n=1 Tax=Phenylobacterium sp. TaxID=1871053 RepID=UPI002E352676|nr:LysR family transcriptional regulator [Phenylobacterium sp.]HEX3367252.1 LysR family transcriptional regulator [Phenylobacterium sp.]
MMNLRHIEVFHAVYINGSVSAAARALSVSQPSVSNVLRHAESRLGFPLFKRAKGRLVPTDEAHALFFEVSDIYDRVGSLRQTAKNLAHASDGHIRIGVLPGFGIDVAPLAVAAFRRKHPKVSFDIQTLHHADIPRLLQERHCDIAIAYENAGHEKLEYAEIGRRELVLLYRKAGMPDLPSRVGLEMLEDRDFVSLAHSGPLGTLFSREVARLNLDIRETVTISTMYVAAALVREGVGVAVVDDFTARVCAADDMDYRPLAPALSFGVYSVCLADRPLSRITRSFISLIGEMTGYSPADASAGLRIGEGRSAQAH